MTKVSDSSAEPNCSYGSEINLLALILVLARQWQVIVGITIIVAIVSTILAMSKPTVYTSSAKLLVLEFIDQTDVVRVGNDGKLVRGKFKWGWRPADASVIKNIMESTALKQNVKNKCNVEQCSIQIIQDKQQLGTITVKVDGNKQAATAQIVATTVKEAAELAFRMGLLTSPALLLDDALKIDNGSTMAMRLLEAPADGIRLKPGRHMSILLSTMTGLFCSILFAFVLDYFQNLSDTDRLRLAEVKEVFKSKNAKNIE